VSGRQVLRQGGRNPTQTNPAHNHTINTIQTCQSKDWKFAHSLECAIFSKLKPRVLPVNARAVLRIVQRSARRKYTPQELDLFQQLETHEKEIRHENAPQWERIALSSKAVKAYSQTDTPEDTISAFGAKVHPHPRSPSIQC
jgi:SET and MYND domain-containing protein